MDNCAALDTGSAVCWGENRGGQLGDNTFTDRNTPVQVLGPGGVGTLADVDQIVGGTAGDIFDFDFSCAAKTDGTIWCWGENVTGQLGNGTTTDSFTPVQTLI